MGKLIGWIDDRFPLIKMWNEHLAEYYVPRNFNFWYFFGSLALMVLMIQIVSGIFLAMHYKPDSGLAFDSVEYIMRDVPYGWLIRYTHSTGATAFFVVIYLHMLRGLMYGSYKKPRELIWLFGMFIYLCLMAEAFMGYLLPWGQMSYWGAQVITSLFGAVPVIGDDLTLWIRGDFLVSDATLNRFFSLHVIALPLVLVFLVVAHILALHEVGSNNPDGVEIRKDKGEKGIPLDGIPFHPYYTVKDFFGVVVFLYFFSIVLFFFPDGGGYLLENANLNPSDPLMTPGHITPAWYFTPFYSILRAVPDKLLGVGAMGAAIVLLFFMPWIDRCNVRSIRYRSNVYKINLMVFTVSIVALGWLAMQHVNTKVTILSQIFTLLYFSFFIVLFITSKNEVTRPIPDRVTK